LGLEDFLSCTQSVARALLWTIAFARLWSSAAKPKLV
jgi:hypothetical protein